MAAKPKHTASDLIALTMGDPAGIGMDLTARIWHQRASNQCPPFLFYGDADALRERGSALGFELPVKAVASADDALGLFDTHVPVLPVQLAAPAIAGQANAENAAAILGAIEQATAATVAGKTAAIVTNPIAKATLYDAGFKHPGHTEFLAALAEQHYPGRSWRAVMMLAADELSVVPLTVHIPLKDVPETITGKLIIETAKITLNALTQDFGIINPRLAVAGLNPHAGESGAMGREDGDVIAPAVAALVDQGYRVTGPWPADTLFHEKARAGYDAVLAMYHDQALIPLKTIAFDRGVNVTLGLPFVRTSPDHGTAFDIAGSGKADTTSLLAAMKMALEMSQRRERALHTHEANAYVKQATRSRP